jgi:acyl-CoA reductase-like NAD-dependent aldehyde dehydrogenase
MCVSVERIYVHEQVYDRFVDAVVRDVDALKVGSGDGFNYGSLIDQNQLELIERHVDDAKAKGARVLSGGKRMPGNGVFYPPTVLVDVDHSMACMTEETFGQAIRLANDSPYGPSASVFSGDLQRAKEVAVQLDCGAVNINDAVSNLSCTSAPMGGWKSSGIGARFGGAEGLRRFSRVETVVEPKIKFGAGANYYTASPRAQARMNKQTTWMALRRPRRAARER